ncbi:hypothetical protein PC129_g16261 [Phytophthora cactorum]|uniref:Uncharacterized protein n=1 Tax=Phytophthora cactorum TaxID=29920 RepID=A0A8T0YS95_9STRA|nr:hypothetical protein Pcac1_g15716 [Phytophthora cactorum]KAG3110872.1 hypothetical protein PI125_g9630 [Phytophthora idaei]KAG2806808.1 hypothetical protein PC112_g17681 [Phytophthora cactorum]KAG2808486.1 hypothetical protein PC111_g16463 [Phytophthora cactorum]KAG2847676.1 hypothetical protein PC113_g17704 [Phytophthora cactorum]
MVMGRSPEVAAVAFIAAFSSKSNDNSIVPQR